LALSYAGDVRSPTWARRAGSRCREVRRIGFLIVKVFSIAVGASTLDPWNFYMELLYAAVWMAIIIRSLPER
jgi:hypothetical protein